ncbi:unnamed protein product [Polarella glacialis]|uniref:DUS-like FMN-binding domain-containing protein n=1 Tax=Polarella glacialis TaxID=89957 RepID=A0A813L420_POLGL|nr:unnamed protein product [Polarella glacialis]
MAPFGGEADDDEFQIVGRKGRAIPLRARSGLVKKDEAGLAPDIVKVAACTPLDTCGLGTKAAQPWPREERPVLSVAPMMQWTDVHYRKLARLLTRRTLLFTEMIPAAAIVDAFEAKDGSLGQLLAFDAEQRPLAVQIGGSNPALMARAAGLCAKAGFDEVNLNVGCPSSKVTTGGYGACLMKSPQLVREIAVACLAACGGRNGVPVTVKHRLGVDDCDSWEELQDFVRTVASAGVTHFIVHARKALLGVLSCEGNRTIPPLKYDWVWALSRTFPQLTFELNGGVDSLDEVQQLFSKGPLRGVMVGRAAYKTPWILSQADATLFGAENPGHSREEVLDLYLDYASAYFHAQQRAGLVSTPSAALELEQLLAAPLSNLFEDETHLFRVALLREVAARETDDASSRRHDSVPLPTFMLRRAAACAAEAVAAARAEKSQAV